MAATRQPLLVQDVDEAKSHPLLRDEHFTTGSFISFPLVYHGALVGVVNLTNRAMHGIFVEEDIDYARRLMRAGAAEAAERMALPPLGRLFSRGRVLAMLALAAILVVGLASSLSHGSDANAGVTQVNAPVDGAGLPQASPS